MDELTVKPLIFETSRMDRTKRKDLLLEAFAEVAATIPDCYLLIGGGLENDVFNSLQQQLELTPLLKGRAFLRSAIPDEFVGPMFSVAHIYATASEMEGFGMNVSQAASAGSPVVSTNTIPFSIHHAAHDGAETMFRKPAIFRKRWCLVPGLTICRSSLVLQRRYRRSDAK